MDARLAGVETQFTKELQISRLPSRHTLTYTAILAVEVFCTTGKTGWHCNAGLLERGLGDITQERLVERLQRLVGICQHVPCSGLTFVHPEVVVAVDQRTGETREEDADLEWKVKGRRSKV